MMQANQITKQVLAFQKSFFSSWCGATAILQDQACSTVDAMLDQASWIPVPDQWRQGILRWVSTCKKERDRFNGYMEESLSGLEKCFVPDIKAAPAKAQKPPAGKIEAAPAKAQKPPAGKIEAAPAKAQKPPVGKIEAAPAKAQKPAAEQIKAVPAQETKKATQ